MKDFNIIWKAKASSNKIASDDTIAYAILRAMTKQSKFKTDIAKYNIFKTYSRDLKTMNLGDQWAADKHVSKAVQKAHAKLQHLDMILGVNSSQIFDDKNEIKEFLSICENLFDFDSDRVYVYIAVRQDISPEYQAVQACHAAYKAGAVRNSDPDSTYFALIGVPNEEELRDFVAEFNAFGHITYNFFEPDIGDELTAFATVPIKWVDKWFFTKYPLLVFSRDVPPPDTI